MRCVFLAALTALVPFVASPAQVHYFSASLDGAHEVPSVASAATGWGVVRLDQASGQVDIFVHAEGVSATAAHLHFAVAGINGPVVVPLSGGPSDFAGSGALTAMQVTDLIAGGSYLNVHSAAHLGGEIRGQVLPAVTRRFTTTMDGARATPATPSMATGQTIAYLHEPSNRLTYEVEVTGMVGTLAHIHLGGPGVPGPVVFPLNGDGSRWCGVTAPLTQAQLVDLFGGDFYVNVHSMTFPDGEIRGQLLEDPGDFYGVMDGSQVVPPVVTDASGRACLTLHPDRSLSYEINTTGLRQGTDAHIRSGTPGMNGPIVFPLSGGPMKWEGTIDPLDATQLTTLLAGGYYINIETRTNPNGEIRTQPLLRVLPSAFGSGCVDSGGGRAEIGSEGIACMGSPFVVTLQGTQATADSFLLLGMNRDQFGPAPLPFSLSLLGTPSCFLFHNASLSGRTKGARTDSLGCAKATLNIPMNSGLVGLEFFCQWFIIDQGASSPVPLVASNGLQVFLE